MKILLFLGAGFSRAYGLPVMREFFDHAKNAPYLKADHKSFLDDYQKKTYNAANTFEPEYRNLEDVLSFCLALENFAGNYPEDTSEDYKRLCRILFEVYRHILEYELNYWNLPLGPLQTFLGLPKKGAELPYELTIITTNYDIITEYAFWRLGLTCHLPIEWKNIDSQRSDVHNMYSRYKGKSPLLCKLHGSLNWFSSESQILTVEGKVIGRTDMTEKGERSVKFPLIAQKNYSLEMVPLIVPPTIFKLQVDQRLQKIWETAGSALKETDKLVFVGFSFPNSDIYIRYFLAANLAENVHLEQIRIIDPSADKICNKLKESGSKFGNRFKELLKPSPMKWGEAREITS